MSAVTFSTSSYLGLFRGLYANIEWLTLTINYQITRLIITRISESNYNPLLFFSLIVGPAWNTKVIKLKKSLSSLEIRGVGSSIIS